jgi:hypothetical protein
MKLVQEATPYLSIIEGRYPRIKFHKRLSDAKHAVNLEWRGYYTHPDGTKCLGGAEQWRYHGPGRVEHTFHRTHRGGQVYVHDEGDEWDLVYNVERGAEIK